MRAKSLSCIVSKSSFLFNVSLFTKLNNSESIWPIFFDVLSYIHFIFMMIYEKKKDSCKKCILSKANCFTFCLEKSCSMAKLSQFKKTCFKD